MVSDNQHQLKNVMADKRNRFFKAAPVENFLGCREMIGRFRKLQEVLEKLVSEFEIGGIGLLRL
jgi:hypothetical protein